MNSIDNVKYYINELIESLSKRPYYEGGIINGLENVYKKILEHDYLTEKKYKEIIASKDKEIEHLKEHIDCLHKATEVLTAESCIMRRPS